MMGVDGRDRLGTALRAIKAAGAQELLVSGLWGIEREGLRVDADGLPSRRPHPFPPERLDITVDFAENQAELVTAPLGSPEAALADLRRLHAELYRRMEGEFLWPLSEPGRWDRPELVRPASFGGDPRYEEERAYRRSIAARYGTARQALSGVHVNISLGDGLIDFLKNRFAPGMEPRAFKDEAYMRLVRNYARFRQAAAYLFSASPIMDPEFARALAATADPAAARVLEACAGRMAGIRQGPMGYALASGVEEKIGMRYESLREYLVKLEAASSPGPRGEPLLHGAREFYAPARPKPARGSGLEALEREGIGYAELRTFDLDPFEPAGIGLDAIRAATVMALAAALMPDGAKDERRRTRAMSTLSSSCTLGAGGDAARRTVASSCAPFLGAMREVAALMPREYLVAVEGVIAKLEGKEERRVERFVREAKKRGGALAYGLALAASHKAEIIGTCVPGPEEKEERHGILNARV